MHRIHGLLGLEGGKRLDQTIRSRTSNSNTDGG